MKYLKTFGIGSLAGLCISLLNAVFKSCFFKTQGGKFNIPNRYGDITPQCSDYISASEIQYALLLVIAIGLAFLTIRFIAEEIKNFIKQKN